MDSLCKHKCGCRQKEKKMFCINCFHNFDSKESFFNFDGIHLCPKCYPDGWSPLNDFEDNFFEK